jgi:hypothetical protein
MSSAAGNSWPWRDFPARYTDGYRATRLVGDRLTAAGVRDVDVPAPVVAAPEDVPQYADEVDITVGPYLLEVKSRRFAFTDTPASYPYPDALVGTVGTWARKVRPRCAVVLVSVPTAGMLVAPLSTRPRWVERKVYDGVRSAWVHNYACPIADLVPLDRLAAYLRAHA